MKNSLLNPPVGTLRVIFLYVGQGDSTLLIVPDGNSHQYIMVDCNSSDIKGTIKLSEYLKNIGDNKLIFKESYLLKRGFLFLWYDERIY